MNVDFVRFKASDGVELQGWLSDPGGDAAIIHTHGMSGNGYENYFLDDLRQLYYDRGIAFFSIDTRGRGVIGDFRQGDGSKRGGSCYELFDESIYDIEGAMQYLQTFDLQKKRFILQGHSLGCTKVVNFWLSKAANKLAAIVLLAPTDMTRWAMTDPDHEAYLAKAKQMIAENNGQELVGAECWLDKTPISAQTYPTICEAGSTADIYGEREGGALLGRVGLPVLIAYGTDDWGIKEIDGTIDEWLDRTNAIKNSSTQISIIEGASHSFRDREEQLTQVVGSFLDDLELSVIT